METAIDWDFVKLVKQSTNFSALKEELENECQDCHGTGEVEMGEFDDIITKKCLCQMEHDGDGEDD